MPRKFWDSTNPNDIPLAVDGVMGYENGAYAWPAAAWDRWPKTVAKVRISVNAYENVGDMLDVESGDATPAQAPHWVQLRQGSGLARPTIYMSESVWPQVQAACKGLAVDYVVANYNNNPAIPAGAVGHQYANEPLTGGHYDWTEVVDTWFPSTQGGPFMALSDAEQTELLEKVREIHTWSQNVATGALSGFPEIPGPDGRGGVKIQLDRMEAEIKAGQTPLQPFDAKITPI